MKIEQMPISDRFDDIIDLVVALKASLEEVHDEDVYLKGPMDDCDVIFRRLSKLKDFVIDELKSKDNNFDKAISGY